MYDAWKERERETEIGEGRKVEKEDGRKEDGKKANR